MTMLWLPWILIAYFGVMLFLTKLYLDWKERDAPEYKRGYKKPIRMRRKR